MTARVLLLIGTVALIAGCATVPTRASPTTTASAPQPDAERIVALVGTVGAMTLMVGGIDGHLEAAGAQGMPADAAWLSGDGSSFVVTTLAGRSLTGSLDAFAPGAGDLALAHPTRAFGTLEPVSPGRGAAAGPRLAFSEGDPGSGGPGRLVVTALSGTTLGTVSLARPAESAPAWLPDGRIALVSRDGEDRPVTLLIDPATGATAIVNVPAERAIGIGARVVATIDDDGATHAGPVAAWLSGAALPTVAFDPADGPALQAAPSPDGRELAIVLADANGDAAAILVVLIGAGWHEIARFVLPRGANRAVVSWLAVR